MMPKAVIFDLGDTVLEEKSYNMSSGYESISEYLSLNTSLEELNNAIAQGQEGNREFKLLEWIDKNLCKKQNSMSAHEIELLLWNETVELVRMDGLHKVLDFLFEQGIRVAAISNAIFSSKCIIKELAKHNLDSYFEFVISSADHGIRKPDTKIFKLALKALDLEPNEIWFIGDRWDADIVGSAEAGMTAVWFGNRCDYQDVKVSHNKLKNWSSFESLWKENK